MIDLQSHPDGVILPVRVQPGAKRNEIRGEHQGALKVCLTQSPEKGKANQALIALVSKSLAVRKSQLELISGATSRQKRLLVRALDRDELARRIEALAAG